MVETESRSALAPTVTAAHRDGNTLYIQWSDGEITMRQIAGTGSVLSTRDRGEVNHDPDPSGHVWKAIVCPGNLEDPRLDFLLKKLT